MSNYGTSLTGIGGATFAGNHVGSLGDNPIMWQDPSKAKHNINPGWWDQYGAPAGIGIGTLVFLGALAYWASRKK